MSEKLEKPILEELTAETAGNGAGLEQLMDPPDPILKLKGGDLKIYKQIRSDDQVKTVLDQRRSAIIAAEWEVDAGGSDSASQQAADDLREQLREMRFDDASKKMWESVYYGFRIGECIWAQDGKRIVLQQVKTRDNARFRFDKAGRPRLLDSTGKGQLLPPNKFWLAQTGAEHDDDPYGLGLAHWLYWPVFFKRQGLAFWLSFLDKLGSPTVWGKHPPTATDPEKKNLLAALNSLRRNGTIITPVGVEIQLLEAVRSATTDYATLIKLMNEAISKIVVGQTMTVDNGSSRSQAEVHQDVRGDIVKADADLLCETFNAGPVRWLTGWNYPSAQPPRVFRRTEAPEDLNKLAERDKNLSSFGFRPSPARIEQVYGEGYEAVLAAPNPAAPNQAASNQAGQAQAVDAATAAAAQPPRQSLADFADAPDSGARPADAVDDLVAQAGAQAEPVIAGIVARAERLLAECETLSEFSDRLIELYPGAPDAVLGEAIAQALALADLQGRATAAEAP